MSNKFTKIYTDDIVISGMSGRFPESNSTDEFRAQPLQQSRYDYRR